MAMFARLPLVLLLGFLGACDDSTPRYSNDPDLPAVPDIDPAPTDTKVCLGLPDGATRPANVLIDQTHDFLFQTAWTLRSGLNRLGFNAFTSEHTLTDELLASVDVLILSQIGHAVSYTPDEIQVLAGFASAGGGILFVGDAIAYRGLKNRLTNAGYPIPSAEAPINDVASPYGLHFSEAPVTQPLVVETLPFPSAVKDEVTFLNSTTGAQVAMRALEVIPPSEAMIRDQNGNAVLARSRAADRVAALGGAALTDAFKQPEADALLSDLLNWLSECAPQRANNALTTPERIFPSAHQDGLVRGAGIRPELEDNINGFTLRYNPKTEVEAHRVAAIVPIIEDHLTTLYGRSPKAQIEFTFFSNAGSGWATATEVGLPGLNYDPAGVVALSKYGVIQHELTHAWRLPLALSSHLLMNFNNYDLAQAYPIMRPHFLAGWRQSMRNLRAVDPTLDALDLAILPSAGSGSAEDRRRWEKWTWAFRVLRIEFGSELFLRLIAQAEDDGIGTQEDIQTLIYYLCQMTEANLYPWFESIGTTVTRRTLPASFSTPNLTDSMALAEPDAITWDH